MTYFSNLVGPTFTPCVVSELTMVPTQQFIKIQTTPAPPTTEPSKGRQPLAALDIPILGPSCDQSLWCSESLPGQVTTLNAKARPKLGRHPLHGLMASLAVQETSKQRQAQEIYSSLDLQ